MIINERKESWCEKEIQILIKTMIYIRVSSRSLVKACELSGIRSWYVWLLLGELGMGLMYAYDRVQEEWSKRVLRNHA